MKLFLFDIDSTLIRSNRVGSKALRRTLERFGGRGEALEQVPLAGQCDWGIWRALLGLEGYGPDEVDAQLEEIWRDYVAELVQILASPAHADPEPLPGVLPLLESLHARDDVLLGLLTGNIEAAAWLKLGRAGLDRYFCFGAFGDEGAERPELPPLAVARAAHRAGHPFSKKEIVILGDTVHDIRCGEALGVCAVGVATGSEPAEALVEAGADFVFDSFANPEQVLAALLP